MKQFNENLRHAQLKRTTVVDLAGGLNASARRFAIQDILDLDKVTIFRCLWHPRVFYGVVMLPNEFADVLALDFAHQRNISVNRVG
jgi:hypothetical protein